MLELFCFCPLCQITLITAVCEVVRWTKYSIRRTFTYRKVHYSTQKVLLKDRYIAESTQVLPGWGGLIELWRLNGLWKARMRGTQLVISLALLYRSMLFKTAFQNLEPNYKTVGLFRGRNPCSHKHMYAVFLSDLQKPHLRLFPRVCPHTPHTPPLHTSTSWNIMRMTIPTISWKWRYTHT